MRLRRLAAALLIRGYCFGAVLKRDWLSFCRTGLTYAMRLRVIDLETSGAHPRRSEIIELGCVDVTLEGDTWRVGATKSWLFRPRAPLTPETQAVHHLMEEDFEDVSESVSDDRLKERVLGAPRPDMLVAHHIRFERHFLPDSVTEGLPWLCTLRIAQKLWPQAPRHSNQVLRYWLTLPLERDRAAPAHRAGPDAYVTAHILLRALEQHTPQKLLELTLTAHARRGTLLRASRPPAAQPLLFEPPLERAREEK